MALERWRRVMACTSGLVHDDEYDDYEPYDEPAPIAACAAPARAGRRRPSRDVQRRGVRTLPREPDHRRATP